MIHTMYYIVQTNIQSDEYIVVVAAVVVVMYVRQRGGTTNLAIDERYDFLLLAAAAAATLSKSFLFCSSLFCAIVRGMSGTVRGAGSEVTAALAAPPGTKPDGTPNSLSEGLCTALEEDFATGAAVTLGDEIRSLMKTLAVLTPSAIAVRAPVIAVSR